VSQQLKVLEREVGTSLLERSNRGVTLTPAGRLLAARVSTILDLLQTTLADVAQTADAATPIVIRVAAFPTAITAILLPLLAHLPAVLQLQIIDHEPEEALAGLAARSVDAAIVDSYQQSGRGAAATDTRLDRTTLLVEQIRLAHPANRRPRSIESLHGAQWVLGGANSRFGQATRTICASAGIEPDVIVETDDHQVAFAVMRSTGAVTLLPELAVRGVPQGIGVSTTIDTGVARRVDLVTRRVPQPNPALSVLTSALHRQLRRPPEGGTHGTDG
jgi:DNA-binding transcriptional LysR family regulator